MTRFSQVKASSMSIKSALLGLTLAAGLSLAIAAPVSAEEAQEMTPVRQNWSFAGILGSYDQVQLQRGFKIYQQVCSNCHALSLISFRNLMDKSGPGFTDGQIKALAASYDKIRDMNDTGDIVDRKGRLSDAFPWAYPNATAAAATLGVAPPDMSLLAKARSYERGFPGFLLDMLPLTAYQEKGVDYIYSLLVNGYVEPPKDYDLPAGTYYNAVYPGHKIAMANPLNLLFDEKTNKPGDPAFYDDKTVFTREQAARDVSSFLMWAAEPRLEERKRLGVKVMIFLAVFAFLLLLVKRRIWANIAH